MSAVGEFTRINLEGEFADADSARSAIESVLVGINLSIRQPEKSSPVTPAEAPAIRRRTRSSPKTPAHSVKFIDLIRQAILESPKTTHELVEYVRAQGRDEQVSSVSGTVSILRHDKGEIRLDKEGHFHPTITLLNSPKAIAAKA